MCGFVGQYNIKEKKYPIRDMLDLISHRGPDDEEFLERDNIYFGFKRLSIIDVDNGKQPISNEYNTIFIVCNKLYLIISFI